METIPIVIENYFDSFGDSPFEEWLESLDDRRARRKIKARLDRVRLGNAGDSKSVGMGVFEFRINWGPGYRVYFGRHGNSLIILLAGGDKSSQERDIHRAQFYWNDYWRRVHETI